ncbi:MAG: hypothetical protein IKI64_09420 [Clostridia bacterium]|nr:hypothetical protein [Clostridia bacterium]
MIRKKAPGGSKRQHRPRLKLAACILLCFAAVIIAFNALAVRPAEALASRKLSATASELLNLSVKEIMDEYGGEFGCFAVTKLNEDGSAVVSMNTAALNLVASRVLERAQAKFAALTQEGISFPLGSASGIAILNGVGPTVRFGIDPVGEVRSKLSSSFQSAGVNQTRFSASIELEAQVEMLLLGGAKSVSARIDAPIVDAVIVGNVPAAYTNVESLEDALNLIPTEAD